MTFLTGCHALSLPARAAALAPAYFGRPDEMLPVAVEAPDGYFQSVAVERVNERILFENGINWRVPQCCVKLSKVGMAMLDDVLADFAAHDNPVLVDPRFVQTLPIWLAACQARGLQTTVLVANDPRDMMIDALVRRRALPQGAAEALADFILAAAPQLQTPCNGVATGVATALAVDAAQKTPCNGVPTGVATAPAVDAAQKTPCNGVATGAPPPRPPRLGGESSAAVATNKPAKAARRPRFDTPGRRECMDCD
jgi:hypothetical protein